MDAGNEFTPQNSIEGISARALAHVGRLLNRPIETALDLAEVTRKGVSPELMTVLIDSGFTRRRSIGLCRPERLVIGAKTVDRSPPMKRVASCAP